MQTRQVANGGWMLAVALVLGAGQRVLGQQVKPWATLTGHKGNVHSLAFSPDGRVLASAGGDGDGTVRLWEVLTGKERATLGYSGRAYAVAFTPDGRLLASGGSDGMARLWDAAGKARGSLACQGRGVIGLAFSPNGTSLAVGVDSNEVRRGELRLWDVRTGRFFLVSLRGTKEDVDSISFSADGRMFAGGDTGGGVTVWETASGKVRASFRWHEAEETSVAFLPCGLLASGGRDGAVRLWDVREGKRRATLKGHDGYITAVAPASTGSLLATAGFDCTVRLWDTATGKQLVALDLGLGAWEALLSVAFSPDGKLLAAGDSKGTIRLWSVARLLAQKGKK